ncbi:MULTISPECIES: VanZ family protein [Blautia]
MHFQKFLAQLPVKPSRCTALLSVTFNRRLSWWKGLLAGVIVSGMIETFQLIFCRGVFEWDDIV